MARLTRLDKIIDMLIDHANKTASEKTKDRLIISVADLQKVSEEDKREKKRAKRNAANLALPTSNRFKEL